MSRMAGLPAGTVSLLFSDIEGSTALLSRLGAAFVDALDAQRRILREAWTSHGGTELGLPRGLEAPQVLCRSYTGCGSRLRAA